VISLLFKALLAAWPFLREMVVGKKAPSEIMSRNKTTLVSVILNILQVLVVFFLIDLTVSLSVENNTLREKQFDVDNETKVQVVVLKTSLEQTQKDLEKISKENSLLRESLGRTDPNRRRDINERLERLRVN